MTGVLIDPACAVNVGDRGGPAKSVSLQGKTILHVLPALQAGGAEQNVLEIAAALRDAGARALVASAGGRMAESLGGGGEHFRLPLDTKNPAALGRNATRLSALIAGEGVDLVHAHSHAPAWSAHFAARRRGRPFVTTFHGVYFAGNAVKRAYNRVMVRADRVIAPSNFVAEHIRTVYGCPEARIRVVHQGIDIASFDPRAVPADIRIPLHAAWAIADGVRVVLLPGRVSRLKGHAVLIEAMREFADEDLAAVFVGSDAGNRAYRRELEALAGNLNVRFIGHRDDMAAVYAASDIVVSASVRPESFGRVLAEAGAMGLPAVAADHGGAREILVHGETGWLVPPADPRALANGIRTALSAAGPALAARARARVESRFTREKTNAATLAVYGELIA